MTEDTLAIPSSFATGFGSSTPRPPNVLADGVSVARIYWTYGAPPRGAPRSDVDDPPCSGWSTVLVLDMESDAKTISLLCPYSYRSYRINRGGYEHTSLHGSIDGKSTADRAAYFGGLMRSKWAEHKRMATANADYGRAMKAMKGLGVEPPSDDELAKMPAFAGKKYEPETTKLAAKPAGKPAAAEGLKKKVKKTSRKGEVLEHFMEDASVPKCEAKLGISRSNVLSQLYLLRKDHGIGYTVNGDSVQLDMPEEDPFDE